MSLHRSFAASLAAKLVAGVTMADDDIMEQRLTVTFDDNKTSVDAIKDAMGKAKFPVEGEAEAVSQ